MDPGPENCPPGADPVFSGKAGLSFGSQAYFPAVPPGPWAWAAGAPSCVQAEVRAKPGSGTPELTPESPAIDLVPVTMKSAPWASRQRT